MSKLVKFMKATFEVFEKVLEDKIVENDSEMCRKLYKLKCRIFDNSQYITSQYREIDDFFENVSERDLQSMEDLKDQLKVVLDEIRSEQPQNEALAAAIEPLISELKIVKYLLKRKSKSLMDFFTELK